MNNIKLRDYQNEAVEAAIFTTDNGENSLLSIATGLGKSIIIAEIIRRLKQRSSLIRCLMLVPSTTLLQQNLEKINLIAPDLSIGVYAAGLKKKDKDKDIIYATVQSYYNIKDEDLSWVNTIITDEVHMISDKGVGMYHDIINRLKNINPTLKVIGLSATCFRMSSGIITEGEHALFKDICYEYNLEQGINNGYLCPLTSKVSKQELDLTNIHIKQGDYDEKELDLLMSNEEKVDLTVKETLELGKDRHSFLWFCTGINHVEMIHKKLQELNESSAIIIGDTSQKEREEIIKKFKNKELRHIISANAIYTGFDAPLTDCLVALRPTKSTGIYVQACGRGVRLDSSKTNCLVLDFANWIQEHGSILDIKIKKQFNFEKKQTEVKVVKVLENTKLCPECRTVLKKADLKCPVCGYLYSKEEVLNHNITPSELDIMAKKGDTSILEVLDYNLVPWTSKSGNTCIRENFITEYGNIASFHALNNYYTMKWFNLAIDKNNPEFIDILDCEFNGNWNTFLSEINNPERIDELMPFIIPFFKKPEKVRAIKEGKYYKIVEIDYKGLLQVNDSSDGLFIV